MREETGAAGPNKLAQNLYNCWLCDVYILDTSSRLPYMMACLVINVRSYAMFNHSNNDSTLSYRPATHIQHNTHRKIQNETIRIHI
jgi:hypothetical protein